MIIAFLRFDTEQLGVHLADILHRLTGTEYFSPESRDRRSSFRLALSELSQMSDGELAELGLLRCDIRRVARETAVTGACLS